MATVWDPEQYRRFEAERSRAFFDLISQIDLPGARSIVDLGCGPGTLTAYLARRWPAASVTGVDNSSEMLDRALAENAGNPRLSFVEADLADWAPKEPVDLIVTNATLQWVPGHIELLQRFAGFLNQGGVFALQVPGNFKEPSHELLAELVTSEEWAPRLQGRIGRPAAHDPSEYYEVLSGAGLNAVAWETTYLQVLKGENAVLDWLKGTALRPVLSVLDPGETARFLDQFGTLLARAYPTRPEGTFLPYRRVFAVASKPGRLLPAVSGLEHVQVAIPTGGEEQGRDFYGGVLGFAEVPKPASLAARGGCWFRGVNAEVHLGVDPAFAPAKKAHVALRLTDLASFAERLAEKGLLVIWDDELAPRRRFYTEDPFGNRIELMEEA